MSQIRVRPYKWRNKDGSVQTGVGIFNNSQFKAFIPQRKVFSVADEIVDQGERNENRTPQNPVTNTSPPRCACADDGHVPGSDCGRIIRQLLTEVTSLTKERNALLAHMDTPTTEGTK